jgi:hypothetical protein
VLPEPPTDAEKASYPWRSLPSLTAAVWLGTLCVIAAQLLFETRNLGSLPVAAGIFGSYTVIYLAHQLLSLPVQQAGPGFDLAVHQALVRSWRPARLPSVGHPASGLRRARRGAQERLGRGAPADGGLSRGGPRPRARPPRTPPPASPTPFTARLPPG